MSAGSWTDPAYEAVAAFVGARTGLTFAPNRSADAEAAIRRGMAKARISEAAVYQQRLLAGQAPLDDLIAEITVGETYFFRDPAQFEFIRRTALPDIQRVRSENHPIRVWSAGCASGEEAYSLAILLEEEGLADRSEILATDISPVALAKARQAIYGTWSLRADDDRCLADRYFRRQGEHFVLAERFGKRVAFKQLNLASDTYPSAATGTVGVDLILCRNVLIYFDRETVQRVAQRLIECLVDGGWLVTGPSDPPLPEMSGCETVVTARGLFYRRRALPRPEWTILPESSPIAPAGLASTIRRATVPPRADQRASRNPVEEAQEAFAGGDYSRAADLTRHRTTDLAACTLRLRALANLNDLPGAERASSEALAIHSLAPELHYLRAIILMRSGRRDEAIRSIRRVIYLDRTLAVAHMTLGVLLEQSGDWAGARSAFRNAHALAAARPPGIILPLSDGDTAPQLAMAARNRLASLEPLDGDHAWR